MILLLGGTTETPQIANLLAESNIEVLISNLTESPVDWDLRDTVTLRQGRLDLKDMCELITTQGITAIVDAAHPYAEQLHTTAVAASSQLSIPYYRYERPPIDYTNYDVNFAADHTHAAELTFALGSRALLTTGTRNLAPYVKIAADTGSQLYVRLLPCQQSLTSCINAGIDQSAIIPAKGPFTIEQNLKLLKKLSIDVLVTKDSGIAGGVIEKLEAASAFGTKVVVIRRPVATGKTFTHIQDLIAAVTRGI